MLVYLTWRVQAKFSVIIGVEHDLSNSLIFLEGGAVYGHLWFLLLLNQYFFLLTVTSCCPLYIFLSISYFLNLLGNKNILIYPPIPSNPCSLFIPYSLTYFSLLSSLL